jgi:hypothetical protein
MPDQAGHAFAWSVHDVRDLLPGSWERDVSRTVDTGAVRKVLGGDSVTSREKQGSAIDSIVVPGTTVSRELPWLDSLYRTELRSLAKREAQEEVRCAVEAMYGVVLNVQEGSDMRYEAHVDSNPVQGLLYLTSHPPGTGGELAVARNRQAATVDEIEADCLLIYPLAGTFVLFDGREHPHYVRRLASDADRRIVASMNFYTPTSPESDRPVDLDQHLFGEIHATA